MWLQNKDDIGILFHEYFSSIPFAAIALDFDGLYTLSSDRVLHRRVVYWHIQ